MGHSVAPLFLWLYAIVTNKSNIYQKEVEEYGDYKKKHKQHHKCKRDWPEFSAEAIIWLKAKTGCGWPEDQSEDYEEIPVTLTENEKQAVKWIIVKKLIENGLTE